MIEVFIPQFYMYISLALGIVAITIIEDETPDILKTPIKIKGLNSDLMKNGHPIITVNPHQVSMKPGHRLNQYDLKKIEGIKERMISGLRVKPIKIERVSKTEYRVLDGVHRLIAAKDLGVYLQARVI